MVPAATALAQTAAAPLPRLGFIYVPHGAVMNKWVPSAAGSDFEVPQILAPLSAWQKDITVVSGLRNKPAESPDPHGITAGTWLRCVAPAGTDDPNDGISCDQVAAKILGQDTPFPSLELATAGGGSSNNGSYSSTVAFKTPTLPLPMESNPRKLYFRLFGEGDNAEERAAIAGETVSLLDLVLDDAKKLNRDLGAQDRILMGEYLESVREIEQQMAKLAEQDLSNLDLPDAPVGVPGDFPTHMELMYNLMALAWQANLTRVATYMTDREVSMRTFNHVGVSDAFHPLSHHQDDPAKLVRLATVQTWYASVFAKFVDKLSNMSDGDGSVLDHSIILYGSNMSNSNLHNNDPIPSVLVGRGNGRLKGGQHLSFEQNTPHANLMLTLLERTGLDVDKHGDSTGLLAGV
jgi:hypothetical protein